MLNKNRNTIPTLQYDDHEIVDDSEKAEVFQVVGNKKNTPLNEETFSCINLADDIVISSEEVTGILNNLNINKTNGLDNN